jgi:hypothetical protein
VDLHDLAFTLFTVLPPTVVISDLDCSDSSKSIHSVDGQPMCRMVCMENRPPPLVTPPIKSALKRVMSVEDLNFDS